MSTDGIIKYTQKILFKESLRVFNEHEEKKRGEKRVRVEHLEEVMEVEKNVVVDRGGAWQVHWTQEEVDELKDMMEKFPGNGRSWRYWETIREIFPDFLPHRTPKMMDNAWRTMKANPKKKYPKKGEEMAPKFAYTHFEDGMLRGMAKKYFELDGYSPGGLQYWEKVREHKDGFLLRRSIHSIYDRMSKLIAKEQRLFAEHKRKNVEKFVFPEIPKKSFNVWTEEERSMLEAVVAAHPTINDLMPGGRGAYWKAFRESHPDFLKGRSNVSLGTQWSKMTRKGGKKKRLTPLEKEAQTIMEEIEEEDDIEELENEMAELQQQLEDADEDEILVLIDEIEELENSINQIKQSNKRQKLMKIVGKDDVAEIVIQMLKK